MLGLNSAKPFTAREAVHIKADAMLKGFNGVRLEKNITVHISRSTGTNSTLAGHRTYALSSASEHEALTFTI